MITNHAPIDIATFGSNVKAALQRNAEIKEFQNLGEIEDFSVIDTAYVQVTAVCVYIDRDTVATPSIYTTLVENIARVLSEHPRCCFVQSFEGHVLGIIDTPFKSDIDMALDSVGKINALLNLANKVQADNLKPTVKRGIGMSYGQSLLNIALNPESPVYNWSGGAVKEAVGFAELACNDTDNRVRSVYASYTIYNNLKDSYKELFHKDVLDDKYYSDPVNIAFNKWINENV